MFNKNEQLDTFASLIAMRALFILNSIWIHEILTLID